ncbi:unnamed protein product [Symbiodinium natans]|uniref:Hint domain-containing protein n=1 Tax=Symbiodinium natans TaxID=878477 RepID=A0A812TEK8_9DINO|nr:unnamed protein product [Symbiodinium natans]
MPHLYNLTVVPAGWPLETVLDAFVHLTDYDPAVAGAQRAREALAARLVELWAARPAEAAAWRGLNEDRSQERLAELLLQHARSEVSRFFVRSFSEAGLEREARSWPPPPEWWEARFRALCWELAGRLAAAEAEAEETARKRQKVEEKGQEEKQLREEKRQLGERLEAAEAELHSAKEEVAQQKLQNAQLGSELQAARCDCELLTERLAAAEATLADKARELQAAQGEGAAQRQRCEELARRLEASEAEASGKQRDVQRLQDECNKHKEHCEQLANRLATAEAVSGSKADLQTLLENAALKERGELLGQQLAKAEAKLSQMQALWEEQGVYKERCRQLERQLAEAKQQSKYLGDGCSAPGILGHRGAGSESGEASESNLTDQMGYTLVDSDGDAASSVLSCSSWFSVKPHCFMLNAIFKTRSYGTDFFLMGRDLKKGSQVVAGDDATILEVAANPELCRATEVVDLQAGAANLRVTPDHLVQVPDATGDSGTNLYVPAGKLAAGDLVMLDSGEPIALTSVAIRPMECEVLKITFEPHLPVAVFSSPPCILSLGHKPKPPIRRGWEKKRGQAGPVHRQHVPDESRDGGASIPATAGEYMD